MARKAVKKPGAKMRSPGAIVLGLILMGLFIGELLAVSWCRVQYTQVGYEIARATREQTQLTAAKKKLQVELARLKSPERLAGIANASIGLEMPSSRQMVVIE